MKKPYRLKLTREEIAEIATALEVWHRDLKLPDPVSGIVEEPERAELTAKLLNIMRDYLDNI